MGYGYADLTQDDLSYTISGLSPGVSYTVYVSALNRHGQGVRAALEDGAVTPPLTVPPAPNNVTVSTKGYNATEGDGIGDSQVIGEPQAMGKAKLTTEASSLFHIRLRIDCSNVPLLFRHK